MSISFGVGPVGYQEGLYEEKIQETVDKIDKEMKEAGLPWWAGIFNPEIVKLAEIGREKCNCAEEPESAARGECNCAKEERERELQEKIEKVKEENERIRGELEEQRERIRKEDELVVRAIRMELSGMEKLEELLNSTDAKRPMTFDYVRAISEAGNTIARLRQSMNGVPFYGYRGVRRNDQ